MDSTKKRQIRKLLSEGTKDIVTYDEYVQFPELYRNTKTAIEIIDDNNIAYALPYRNKGDDRPGVYNEGVFSIIKYPSEEDNPYIINDKNVLDLTSSKNVNEYMKNQQILKEMETESLTSPDNIFVAPISEEDNAETKALKEAINAKHIDIDKYSDRFGKNFPNDKRGIREWTEVSIKKIKSICENLDMKVTIKIEDKNEGDVPNPMGVTIEKTLTKEGLYNDN